MTSSKPSGRSEETLSGHPLSPPSWASSPISTPEDQLASPLRGGLKWFFAQRSDNFGVGELYRVGAHEVKPAGTVGLWVAVLTEEGWGRRSTDRDHPVDGLSVPLWNIGKINALFR